MKSIFRVAFYLRSNYLNKEGKSSVMIRIYLNNERTSLGSSGIFVNPESWDSKSNKVMGRGTESLQLNLQLDNIKNHIMTIYKSMEFDETLSLDVIKSKYFGRKSEMDTITDLFNSHIASQNKLVGISITSASVKKYDVCKRHFIHFLEYQYGRKDLSLKEITPAVINDFDAFIRTEIKQNMNTANKTMKTLKTIVLLGKNLGLISGDPYLRYKPKTVIQNRGFLTEEELMKIFNKELHLPRLNLIRDIFIFSCFTGLAFIDITMLKKENIVVMNDKKWIMTKRKKTGVETNVLLLEIPEKIIQKYAKDTDGESCIFSMLSNQKTNAYLKEIADLCGIKKNLTFHMARHTFATMSLSKGVSMESVSKMLGHTNIKTTQIYARITNKKIEHDMEQLAGKLGKFNDAINKTIAQSVSQQ